MKLPPLLAARHRVRVTGCLLLVLGLAGCTKDLWDKDTFANRHQAANPRRLELFYAADRQDFLVCYDDQAENRDRPEPRCYWLEPNTVRINEGLRPHFVGLDTRRGLTRVPVSAQPPAGPGVTATNYYAVARPMDYGFTLYAGTNQLDTYQLPLYADSMQRVKQVLLTPFAVAVDATIVGVVVGFYCIPGLLNGLNH